MGQGEKPLLDQQGGESSERAVRHEGERATGHQRSEARWEGRGEAVELQMPPGEGGARGAPQGTWFQLGPSLLQTGTGQGALAQPPRG